MLRFCFWTILLCGAAASQFQDEQSDVCSFHHQTWRDTLQNHQERCLSIVDDKANRFQDFLAQEIGRSANGSQTRHESLDEKLIEIQSTVDNLTKTLADLNESNIQEMENMKQQTVDSHRELQSTVEEKFEHFSQELADLKEQSELLSKTVANQESISRLKELQEGVLSAISESKVEIQEYVNQALSLCFETKRLNLKSDKIKFKDVELIRQSFDTEHQELKKKLASLEFHIQKVNVNCSAWKEEVNDLNLTKLETGAYYFSAKTGNYTDLVDFCESKGMHSVIIETEKEFDLIKEQINPQSSVSDLRFYSVWASDTESTPGHFLWADGRKVDEKWRNDWNRSGKGNTTCLFLYEDYLSDLSCSYEAFDALCEVNVEYLKCL